MIPTRSRAAVRVFELGSQPGQFCGGGDIEWDMLQQCEIDAFPPGPDGAVACAGDQRGQ